MGYSIVVCVKQVPDTANLTADAMKEDGTVNRTALPAIFNPEDLNALELALQITDTYGGTVTALNMGLPKAADVLRECLYRGADRAVLLTDRRLAASDTLATSYALACAVRQMGQVDLVLCGRQAIDGDTAQVGPQMAEKLGVTQFTYVEEVRDIADGAITVKRAFEHGHEVLRGPLPALLTVTSSANDPRPPSAKLLMRFKKARAMAELGPEPDAGTLDALRAKGLEVEQWDAERAQCDLDRIGGKNSPTRVKNVDSVQISGTEHRRVEPTEGGLGELVQELIDEHIFD